MSLMSKIGHGLKSFFVGVGHVFEKAVGKDAAKKFAAAAMEMLKSDLGKIVVKVVEGLEANVPSLSTGDKRAQAVRAVLDEAKAAGIDATENIARQLIESAVGVLKGHFYASETEGAPAPGPDPEPASSDPSALEPAA